MIKAFNKTYSNYIRCGKRIPKAIPLKKCWLVIGCFGSLLGKVGCRHKFNIDDDGPHIHAPPLHFHPFNCFYCCAWSRFSRFLIRFSSEFIAVHEGRLHASLMFGAGGLLFAVEGAPVSLHIKIPTKSRNKCGGEMMLSSSNLLGFS
jgi:hypothetical protein